MAKGILLFCFNTKDTQYHKILEKCVHLIRNNLKLEISVVTDFETYKQLSPLGFINYKFIEPERGNTKIGKEWNNVDRHLAYELSPMTQHWLWTLIIFVTLIIYYNLWIRPMIFSYPPKHMT